MHVFYHSNSPGTNSHDLRIGILCKHSRDPSMHFARLPTPAPACQGACPSLACLDRLYTPTRNVRCEGYLVEVGSARGRSVQPHRKPKTEVHVSEMLISLSSVLRATARRESDSKLRRGVQCLQRAFSYLSHHTVLLRDCSAAVLVAQNSAHYSADRWCPGHTVSLTAQVSQTMSTL